MSPTAAGTRRPAGARGRALPALGASRAPVSNARTIGAQPSAWTDTIRGRSGPIRPSASSSSNAFHMPTRPVPPPVG